MLLHRLSFGRYRGCITFKSFHCLSSMNTGRFTSMLSRGRRLPRLKGSCSFEILPMDCCFIVGSCRDVATCHLARRDFIRGIRMPSCALAGSIAGTLAALNRGMLGLPGQVSESPGPAYCLWFARFIKLGHMVILRRRRNALASGFCSATIRQISWGGGAALLQAAYGAGDRSQLRLFRAFVYAATVLSLAIFLMYSLDARHGEYDGWEIWNMHARFLFRGGSHWTDGFTNLLDYSHPDYPLLLPASIARSWLYSGVETQITPITIALAFTFGTVALLTFSLWNYAVRARDCWQGWPLSERLFSLFTGRLSTRMCRLGFITSLLWCAQLA